MRMRKVTESKKPLSLEELAGSFLAMKKAQKLGQETLYDYEKQIERFLRSSHNSLDYAILEQDTLNFFAAIPDTSPARYNKPYQIYHSMVQLDGEAEVSPSESHQRQ